MLLKDLFEDKKIKAKDKVSQMGDWLEDGSLAVVDLLLFADKQVGAKKASCLEAVEYASRANPEIVDEPTFLYMTRALNAPEPRVKWESAKVIGNTAKLHLNHLDKAILNLLKNAKSNGTVVRWAAAFALSEILTLGTGHNKKLLPKIEKLSDIETDNGVKKKYLGGLKKVKK